ncbi:MAG TPA: hypothetical protein DCX54_12330 [Flavobacteriales bacterium]|nr:hypothetical protein [Flavobacteriales bacterium]
METAVTSDIFKFMALRAPKNFEHDNDLVSIIRDKRIQDTYLPDEVHTVGADQGRFDLSEVALFVYNQIQAKLPELSSEKEMITRSDSIAEAVKMQFSIKEKTERPWIDEFVSLIKQQVTEFNKPKLITGLDQIVKKHFDTYSGVFDYLTKKPNANADKSPFCSDFDYLFERLYALYVCKRLYPINLEYVLDGLKALHIIRLLRFCDPEKPFTPSVSPKSKSQEILPFNPFTNCAEANFIPENTTAPKVTIKSKDELAGLFHNATPYIHQIFACLLGRYKPFNKIRPLGLGDLLVVKQFLCKYEEGEIAHVENVLKGESKERTHRRLDRTEELFSTQTEKNEETEKELQTTDRYELKNEAETTIQNDLNAEISGEVSGKYGTVEFSASTGVSYSLSTSDSHKSANNFAKDIVDRSLTRVQKRVREERATKKIYEVEETNKHGINNTGASGTGHITGIYRWLDKYYKAQVYNYGKRLMFEFVVPQPAAFIAAAFERNKNKQSKLDAPQKPAFPVLDISEITDATVDTYTVLYNISDLEPMPGNITKTIAVQGDKPDGHEAYGREYNCEVTEGFHATAVKIVGGIKFNDTADDAYDWPNRFFISVGDYGGDLNQPGSETPNTSAVLVNVGYQNIGNISNKVAITILAHDVLSFALTVSIKMQPSADTLRKWKIKTYQRIMDAYEKRLAEYNSALAEYQDKLDGYNASKGIVIQGRNPRINQEIIKTELKKHCITMLTKQFDIEKADDIQFDAMKSRTEQISEETTVSTEIKKVTQTTPEPGTTVTVTETTITESSTTSPVSIEIPAIDIAEAKEEGSIIQFIEQAFEWPQISYLLYPYFWGKMPENWFEAQKYYDETDPLYAKFLQAGSARVIIAVRPAYQVAVMHYLCTKKPWNGGSAPGINHPLYIPIHEELRNQQDDLNGAEPYGEPWDVVVPTSLVYLQKSADLPTYDCEPLKK